MNFSMKQIANSIENQVSRKNKLQILYRGGPGQAAQRNSTVAPAGVLVPSDSTSTTEKQNGESKISTYFILFLIFI